MKQIDTYLIFFIWLAKKKKLRTKGRKVKGDYYTASDTRSKGHVKTMFIVYDDDDIYRE